MKWLGVPFEILPLRQNLLVFSAEFQKELLHLKIRRLKSYPKHNLFISVLKELGPKGVWKGLVARIIMIGTLTALQWFIYDGVKVALHLPRPPPPQMPESLRQKLEAQKQ